MTSLSQPIGLGVIAGDSLVADAEGSKRLIKNFLKNSFCMVAEGVMRSTVTQYQGLKHKCSFIRSEGRSPAGHFSVTCQVVDSCHYPWMTSGSHEERAIHINGNDLEWFWRTGNWLQLPTLKECWKLSALPKAAGGNVLCYGGGQTKPVDISFNVIVRILKTEVTSIHAVVIGLKNIVTRRAR